MSFYDFRERKNELDPELDQLTEQRTGDESPSNQIAQGISRLPNDQLSELLKLRNEVNLLRKETNELSQLRPENHQLSSASTPATTRSASSCTPATATASS